MKLSSIPKPASCIDLANLVRANPLTQRFSATMTWLSSHNFRESLWRKSCLVLDIFSWTRATTLTALQA